MSVLINGTNGLIQAYDYQALTTGFSYTFSAGTQTLVINPATTLAAGTITMPASPSDGMTITFSSTKQITALTLNGNTGQTVVSGVSVLPANQATTYIYRSSNTTWYPMSTVATNAPVSGGGSTINSGTAVASTSGTSIDFTSIPSWVKRITVMFNGVSTSGTSIPQLQLGVSGAPETTGYSTMASYVSTTNNTTRGATATSGFIFSYSNGAAETFSGTVIFTLLGSNTWTGIGCLYDANAPGLNNIGGVKALAGTLNMVRITTVNGTDTFDAGSINILYE